MANRFQCKKMHIGRTKRHEKRRNILEEVNQEKDLGIIISSYLKCSQQCLYAYNKADKKKIINEEPRITMSLYKTLVRPHVECCSSAWSPLYKKMS